MKSITQASASPPLFLTHARLQPQKTQQGTGRQQQQRQGTANGSRNRGSGRKSRAARREIKKEGKGEVDGMKEGLVGWLVRERGGGLQASPSTLHLLTINLPSPPFTSLTINLPFPPFTSLTINLPSPPTHPPPPSSFPSIHHLPHYKPSLSTHLHHHSPPHAIHHTTNFPIPLPPPPRPPPPHTNFPTPLLTTTTTNLHALTHKPAVITMKKRRCLLWVRRNLCFVSHCNGSPRHDLHETASAQ
ncbi:hypothetical protein Pmani_033119 [Petrolisthes manimaculis]|uniref:Uncharacterized protein n=1 Tax=Petrolisthes manimaculis TaxID=1843537 RepID=A0AAE1TT14_9EUCA|nr:hypothetical protein Pmani_033119 [Petrolisthes manimaculis]